jgi:AcrR family transcriptional regulator
VLPEDRYDRDLGDLFPQASTRSTRRSTVAEASREPRLSVWLQQPRARRGAKAPSGLSRERIVAAAVRLLDEEGLRAFSMRKLATELGVTPMSVYWYVENKDDLIELALDEVFQEIVVPPAPEGEPDPDRTEHQRTQRLKELAREFRRVLLRHPWATESAGTYFSLGPGALRVSYGAIDIVASAGLAPEQCAGALDLIVQFVYGFAGVEGNWKRRAREAGIDEEEYYTLVYDAFAGSHPEMMEQAERVAANQRTDFGGRRDREFELALDCAILGIDAMARAARLVRETGQSTGQSTGRTEKHRSDLGC